MINNNCHSIALIVLEFNTTNVTKHKCFASFRELDTRGYEVRDRNSGQLQRADFTNQKSPSLPLTGIFLCSAFSYVNTLLDNKSAFIKLIPNALMFSLLLNVFASSFPKVPVPLITLPAYAKPSRVPPAGILVFCFL